MTSSTWRMIAALTVAAAFLIVGSVTLNPRTDDAGTRPPGTAPTTPAATGIPSYGPLGLPPPNGCPASSTPNRLGAPQLARRPRPGTHPPARPVPARPSCPGSGSR
jgi:hypothetical protein